MASRRMGGPGVGAFTLVVAERVAPAWSTGVLVHRRPRPALGAFDVLLVWLSGRERRKVERLLDQLPDGDALPAG